MPSVGSSTAKPGGAASPADANRAPSTLAANGRAVGAENDPQAAQVRAGGNRNAGLGERASADRDLAQITAAGAVFDADPVLAGADIDNFEFPARRRRGHGPQASASRTVDGRQGHDERVGPVRGRRRFAVLKRGDAPANDRPGPEDHVRLHGLALDKQYPLRRIEARPFERIGPQHVISGGQAADEEPAGFVGGNRTDLALAAAHNRDRAGNARTPAAEVTDKPADRGSRGRSQLKIDSCALAAPSQDDALRAPRGRRAGKVPPGMRELADAGGGNDPRGRDAEVISAGSEVVEAVMPAVVRSCRAHRAQGLHPGAQNHCLELRHGPRYGVAVAVEDFFR